MKTRRKGYGILLALTILFSLASISTLMPQASASKACLLGYEAHCTFTPISTVICVLMAGWACALRKRKFTDESS